jgi:ditrans,polycis-polyprenyl diphosphate synthase
MGEEEQSSGSSSWLRSLCCKVLRAGHIPRHVAIIMDGNRRFARKMRYNKVFQGHVLGFSKFIETLEWCLDLGVTEMTVYVFSIENYKRSKEEVDGLMELAKQKVAKLLDKRYGTIRPLHCRTSLQIVAG